VCTLFCTPNNATLNISWRAKKRARPTKILTIKRIAPPFALKASLVKTSEVFLLPVIYLFAYLSRAVTPL